MRLDRIEILGFRGIKRLSIQFDDITTLVGENTWGKSSLLDALSIALPLNETTYQFTLEDFHVDYAQSLPQMSHLQIITRWVTQQPKEHRNSRYRKFKSAFIDGNKEETSGLKVLNYQVSATREGTKITTEYQFLDEQADVIPIHDSDKLALELAKAHPVIRLRDARRLKSNVQELTSNTDNNHKLEKRIHNTYRRLLASPGHVNKGELKSTLMAMQHLVEHYFSFRLKQPHKPIQREALFSSQGAQHTSSQSLMGLLTSSQNTQSKLLLMGLLNAYLQAKGTANLHRAARPILIIEDPEGRLHPTNLLKSWEVLSLIPMQKVLTTNSGVLLSAVPLYSIRRLIRESDKTSAFSVPNSALNRDDLRRIAFHIRFHRPNALFARCWLLVEGETEVWIFNEIAKIYGYNLAAEGIQIIEFAQSGLKSLIKIAKALHIEWHVVVDGDPAGKKYAHTVRNQLGTNHEKRRLTELPDRDIEHFLYNHGFEHYFKSLVHIDKNHPIPDKKIVQRVVKKFAKPDLALGIVEYCEQEGLEVVPLLIRQIIKRILTMSNSQH